MDHSTKSRIRLWLQSERAMGLPSVGPGEWTRLSVAAQPVAGKGIVLPNRAKLNTAVPTERVSRPEAGSVVKRPNVETLAVLSAPRGEMLTLPLSAPFSSPLMDTEQRRVSLAAMDEGQVRTCVKCPLCHTRQNTVFGEGDPNARLMFIGEGPGFKEDQTGRPFVGPSGELLNKMIAAMGVPRDAVYITNVVKCRAFHPGPPPKDRAPAPEETAACAEYLKRQVEIIRPSVIVTLGLPASQSVLQTRQTMSKMRGIWTEWHGIKLMPTWHPSYLLRREKDGDVGPKRQAWSDLQQVMSELGMTAAKKGSVTDV